MYRLASKSPRRKEILEMAGYVFETTIMDVEEDIEKNNPEEYVMKTAYKKGIECFEPYPDDIIISADTIVVMDNMILEKPKDKSDAFKMISLIEGKSHFVYTGVFIGCKKLNKTVNFYEKTTVNVGKMTKREIEEYINTSEPYDKAGGYAVQGLFGKYIESINGDYFNVMGLPIHKVNKALKEF